MNSLFRIMLILVAAFLLMSIGWFVRLYGFEENMAEKIHKDILESQLVTIRTQIGILRAVREGKREQAIYLAEIKLMLEVCFLPVFAKKANIDLDSDAIKEAINEVLAYSKEYNVLESKRASHPVHQSALRFLEKHGYLVSPPPSDSQPNKSQP